MSPVPHIHVQQTSVLYLTGDVHDCTGLVNVVNVGENFGFVSLVPSITQTDFYIFLLNLEGFTCGHLFADMAGLLGQAMTMEYMEDVRSPILVAQTSYPRPSVKTVQCRGGAP